MRFETRDLSVKLSAVLQEDELMRNMGCGGCDSTAGHPCQAPSFAAPEAGDTGDLTHLRRQLKATLDRVN